ncbi:MAG: MBL fold metallo-hydrolase [Verrucomicrobiales bacterium]|nr:MBL fold metallo-hydrolase [Verrucomicrobiales bacterium]
MPNGVKPKRKLSIRQRLNGDGNRAGLIPQKGWARRNYQYFSGSLLPALVRKRERSPFLDRDAEFHDLEPGEMEVIWIGHASFLVRTSEFNALIDPVWTKWMGPIKRSREPGVPLEQIPPIDLILITHAHFDHLCRWTLKRILQPDLEQTILVPHGVEGLVRKLQFGQCFELEDWDEFDYRGSKVTFTPAQHWGARMIADMNRGFGGYSVETGHHTLYHSGDSAYFDGFEEIGDRLDIDTAILPIGAYDCPSGREVHMNPEEAVQAFHDLKAEQMIPMHHSTFAISNEKLCEPVRRLKDAVKTHELEGRVIVPHEGEPIIV